jgi:hypothetical protein
VAYGKGRNEGRPKVGPNGRFKKQTVAISEKHVQNVRVLIEDHYVQFSVVIEIASGECDWSEAVKRVSVRGLEGPVAVPKEHSHVGSNPIQ